MKLSSFLLTQLELIRKSTTQAIKELVREANKENNTHGKGMVVNHGPILKVNYANSEDATVPVLVFENAIVVDYKGNLSIAKFHELNERELVSILHSMLSEQKIEVESLPEEL